MSLVSPVSPTLHTFCIHLPHLLFGLRQDPYQADNGPDGTFPAKSPVMAGGLFASDTREFLRLGGSTGDPILKWLLDSLDTICLYLFVTMTTKWTMKLKEILEGHMQELRAPWVCSTCRIALVYLHLQLHRLGLVSGDYSTCSGAPGASFVRLRIHKSLWRWFVCTRFMSFCEGFQTITGHAYVDTAKLVLCGPQCFLAFLPACCCAIAPHASDSAKDWT